MISRALPSLATATTAALLLVGCGDPASSGSDTSTGAGDAGTTSGVPSSAASGEATSKNSGSSSSSGRSSDSSTASGSDSSNRAPAASSCVRSTLAAMPLEQRAGQLLMVALTPQAGASGLDNQLADLHVGNMLYLGGWQDASSVGAASTHLQEQAPQVDGRPVGLLVAADQEGGQVQQLTGEGFTSIPSALSQAELGPSTLRQQAKGWGAELEAAGVNVNLAPTADTVPAAIGRDNGPIGQYDRQYGSTPQAASTGALAFGRGMRDAGVEPTYKHFPGIGRLTGNTDATADGTTDEVATAEDPHLAPFADAIADDAQIVMVGSARYPAIDAEQRAVFSSKVVDGLLRDDLGFDGVVITDDIGVAAAVADTPLGERATRTIAAGGDIVLTADPSTTATLHGAIVEQAQQDDAFAEQVETSTTRVLALKESMGLLSCS